jgi:ATP-dependent Clp protease ATP-binding subunit ClpA
MQPFLSLVRANGARARSLPYIANLQNFTNSSRAFNVLHVCSSIPAVGRSATAIGINSRLFSNGTRQRPVTLRFKQEPNQHLKQFGRDLTEEAKAGRLDPVIGRDETIQRCLQVLARRTKNNPILIGEAGVGKTAIAEGLAQHIVSGQVRQGSCAKQFTSRNN